MTASELSRKLLFDGADEVTKYLENCPFNQYLHALLIDAMHKQRVDIPMVTLFNELQYQCVHISYDATPGEGIRERFLAEEEAWLKSRPAAQFVFCVVYALLRIKQNITFHEECFLKQLPQMLSGSFRKLSDNIMNQFQKDGISVPDVFPTMTCPIDFIPECGEAWATVTCNYSHYVIEKLILLYMAPEDQLTLVERCSQAIKGEGQDDNIRYFAKLEHDIRADRYWRADSPDLHPNPMLLNRCDDIEETATRVVEKMMMVPELAKGITVYQTFQIPYVQQLNFKPQNVVNYPSEGKEK